MFNEFKLNACRFVPHAMNTIIIMTVIPGFSWNLQSERTKVPNECNNGDKWLDIICGVYKLIVDDATITDLDRFDS